MDGGLCRSQEAVRGRRAGAIRESVGDRRRHGPAACDRDAGSDWSAAGVAGTARKGREGQAWTAARIAVAQRVPHALRPGAAYEPRAARRPSRGGRDAAEAVAGLHRAALRKTVDAGGGRIGVLGPRQARLPAVPMWFRHESAAADREGILERSAFGWADRTYGARFAGVGRRRQAAGRVVWLRVPQHVDRVRLLLRRLRGLRPGVLRGGESGRHGVVHHRLRGRSKPLSARQDRAGSAAWQHVGDRDPSRFGNRATADSRPAESALRTSDPGIRPSAQSRATAVDGGRNPGAATRPCPAVA